MEKKLPKNWVEVAFEDMADATDYVANGSFKSLRENVNQVDHKEYAILVRLKDYSANWSKPFRYVTKDSYEFLEKSSLRKGDLFIANVGYPGKLFIVPDLGQPMTIAPNGLRVRSKKYTSNQFIAYFYTSPQGKRVISDIVTGSAQQKFNKTGLRKSLFPLPPLQEQQRIVSKLDGLFAHLEEIENRIDNLEVIRVKFLQSCLQHDGNYYQRKKIGQYLEEGTARIGENWHAHRLIGVSAKNGIIDLKVGQKKSFEKYKIVRPGDFIYNTMRVNIGSIAIYNGSESALTSPDYVVFRVKHHVSPQLLLRFLKSDQGILEIGANTKGSVRARLYFKSLSEIRMPVAPVHVHTNAEKFLKQFNQGVEKLNQIANSTLKNLRQAILAKAFRGELTEQLDTDGDAAELLKEIQKLKKK